MQAAQIALSETGDLELSVAARLHDIGHLLHDPLFEKHLLLLRIDERAKLGGQPAPDLGFWKTLGTTHLARKHSD